MPPRPANYIEDRTGERLWQRLRSECLEAGTGCDVLVIPHNSNLSGGLLFRDRDDDGAPLDACRRRAARIARSAARSEPAQGRLGVPRGATRTRSAPSRSSPSRRCASRRCPWTWSAPPENSFAREVLGAGLVQQAKLGANPFKLGLIGATDTHLAAPGLHRRGPVRRPRGGPLHESHRGAAAAGQLVVQPGRARRRVGRGELARRALRRDATPRSVGHQRSAHRRALLRRLRSARGPVQRARLRRAGLRARRADGRRSAAPPSAEASPRFAVWAARDAGTADHPGTPLQRIQIVKLWVEDGAARERVYDVAGDAANDAQRRPRDLHAAGTRRRHALLDVARSRLRPERARALLRARRREPVVSLDPVGLQRAQGRLRAGAPDGLEACCDPTVPKTIQERAWTSPIWWTPPRRPSQPVRRSCAAARGWCGRSARVSGARNSSSAATSASSTPVPAGAGPAFGLHDERAPIGRRRDALQQLGLLHAVERAGEGGAR